MDSEGSLQTATILVASCDPAAARRRCAQLAVAGWRTVEVGDPVEILTVVKSYRVDLVLLEAPLADSLGMDLPHVLREISPLAYLPVIVSTEGLPPDRRCHFLDWGADEIITDQMTPAEVAARLRVLLRIKELHDQLSHSRAALQAALQRERQLLQKLRQDNADLRVQAAMDPLTRLQNVRACRDILEHEFRIARRYNQSLSLLMLDVDHFKVVNDTCGHPTGDYILKELAVILKRSVRESDVVARTGGEEFTIVLPQADRLQATAFAERIRREVAAHRFTVYGRTIQATISIGAASYPADAEITDPDMLLYFADQALLLAKEGGRNRVVTVHGMIAAVRARLRRQYGARLNVSPPASPAMAK